jgi:hypothetical protein
VIVILVAALAFTIFGAWEGTANRLTDKGRTAFQSYRRSMIQVLEDLAG